MTRLPCRPAAAAPTLGRAPALRRRTPIVWALGVGLLCARPGACDQPLAAPLRFERTVSAVRVLTGTYAWKLSLARFSVLEEASVAGVPVISAGQASVDFLGSSSTFSPPESVETQGDCVELRGWADRRKQLWYVARYQFFPNQPFVRLVISLVDRHDGPPARPEPALMPEWIGRALDRFGRDQRSPQDANWLQRQIRNRRVEVGVRGGAPARVAQLSSHSFSSPGRPWAEVIGASGSPYKWTRELRPETSDYQLGHTAGDPANRVVWRPEIEGRARLAARYTGFPPALDYKRARGVRYEVVDAGGLTSATLVDQAPGPQDVDLGSHVLSRASQVRLLATGSGQEPTVIAGSLRVTPERGRSFDVPLGERHSGMLSCGGARLGLKDFWQHHPITLDCSAQVLGWTAINEPELWAGGMGLTLEAVIGLGGGLDDLHELLYRPPARRVDPSFAPQLDDRPAGPRGQRYDALLRAFARRHEEEMEAADAYGWRNWGDYPIGNSFSARGQLFEEWGNLQYDLPYGLLVGWLRTGDARLWHEAQASVRHLMDIDLVKFHPYKAKLNGLGRRKGETPRSQSHVLSEPIVDQSFGFRSLLLYHSLTGERWARDLAQQQIERLAWYAVNRPSMVTWGDRPAAWLLRGALAGAVHFPNDPSFDYPAIADAVAGQIATHVHREGRLPGIQPCWQGQIVESLILHHQRTHRPDVAEAITTAVREFLRNDLRQRADGTFEFLYCDGTRKGETCRDEWTDEFNYAALWLTPIAYAAELTGDTALQRRADELFSYLERRYERQGQTRHWTSMLGFPHLYLTLADRSGVRQ